MPASVVPVVIYNWFRSSYPTLTLAPLWIEACVAYLKETFPESTPPQLIKQVESQLLLSDLTTSTLPSPSLLPLPLPAAPTVLFPLKANAVLLQITAVEEIAQPALALLQTLKERQHLEKSRLVDDEIDEAERDRRRIRLEGAEEDEAGEGEWTRGMLKFGLSDGHHLVSGVEWKRISGFSLDDTKLGCKLLVQGVRIVNGILLLSPSCVTIKGHSIEELVEVAQVDFEQGLRARLGMPPLVNGNAPPPALQRAAAPAAPRQPPAPPPPPLLQQQHQLRNDVPDRPPPRKKAQLSRMQTDKQQKEEAAMSKPLWKEEEQDDWGMELDEEAERELLEAEQRAIESAAGSTSKKRRLGPPSQTPKLSDTTAPSSSRSKPIASNSEGKHNAGLSRSTQDRKPTASQLDRSNSSGATRGGQAMQVIEIDDSSDEERG